MLPDREKRKVYTICIKELNIQLQIINRLLAILKRFLFLQILNSSEVHHIFTVVHGNFVIVESL